MGDAMEPAAKSFVDSHDGWDVAVAFVALVGADSIDTVEGWEVAFDAYLDALHEGL